MPSTDEFSALSGDQARVLTRRRRLAGLTVILVLILLLLWARHRQHSVGEEILLQRGAMSLRQALEGEKGAFTRAEVQFTRAVKSMVLDGFPLFCLEVTRSFKDGQLPQVEASYKPSLEALSQARWPEAVSLAHALPDNPGRRWLIRLLDAMKLRPSPDQGP